MPNASHPDPQHAGQRQRPVTFVQYTWRVTVWLTGLTAVFLLTATACTMPTPGQRGTPLPLPTELATTPFPEESQPGNWDATFISVSSAAGTQNGRCHKLLRFYPDGLLLYSNFACFPAGADAASQATDVAGWFRRENAGVTRGDYVLEGQRLWLRAVMHDAVHETAYLRTLQGEYCEGQMVLQEPGILTYTGVPSELTQPVQEYILLSGNVPETLTPPCRVAGFRFLWRSYITLAGGEATYRIQTAVGERCSLRYVGPDGTRWPADGPAVILADEEGVCAWQWPVGDVRGQGVATVEIDTIRQDFAIQLN